MTSETMISKKDLKVDDWGDFFSFLLIIPFIAFVFPFLGAVWTLGFFSDITGWLDT